MTLTSDAGTHNAQALAVLRIAVGILFLIFAEYKVLGTQCPSTSGKRTSPGRNS
jgi:hypothetical protein